MSVRDPIGFELFRNTLLSIADEMALTIFRTTYSGVLKDNMDYSTGFADAEGKLVAQGLTLPGHLGSVPTAMESIMRHFRDDMEPGDVFIMNDPFDGGIHLQDIFVFRPVFLEDELIGFATTTAHHGDVGGRLPGSAACDNTEIFQEGIRMPVVREHPRMQRLGHLEHPLPVGVEPLGRRAAGHDQLGELHREDPVAVPLARVPHDDVRPAGRVDHEQVVVLLPAPHRARLAVLRGETLEDGRERPADRDPEEAVREAGVPGQGLRGPRVVVDEQVQPPRKRDRGAHVAHVGGELPPRLEIGGEVGEHVVLDREPVGPPLLGDLDLLESLGLNQLLDEGPSGAIGLRLNCLRLPLRKQEG